MIRLIRKIFGLTDPPLKPDIQERLESFSPEFSSGFDERVLKRVHDKSFEPSGDMQDNSSEPFTSALLFGFQRVGLATAALTLALIVFDVSKADDSAILSAIANDAPEIEEIIADPLFAQLD